MSENEGGGDPFVYGQTRTMDEIHDRLPWSGARSRQDPADDVERRAAQSPMRDPVVAEVAALEDTKTRTLISPTRTVREDQPFDPVSKPPHYNFSNIEPIVVIEDWQLTFCLGNTVKYIARAGRKDPSKKIEDLEKARWYLDREIARLKKEKAT